MKDDKLYEIYLNWKGLEFIHSCKKYLRVILALISIGFMVISVKINNTYILLFSVIVLFLQILAENNKFYYLKYKEIYEKAKNGKIENYKSWISFLENTKGLNSFSKKIFSKFFKE
jgi:hypothetical protein